MKNLIFPGLLCLTVLFASWSKDANQVLVQEVNADCISLNECVAPLPSGETIYVAYENFTQEYAGQLTSIALSLGSNEAILASKNAETQQVAISIGPIPTGGNVQMSVPQNRLDEIIFAFLADFFGPCGPTGLYQGDNWEMSGPC